MGDDPSDITEFLARLGLSNLAQTFAAEDIDLSVLPMMDKDDLKELGLTIGQRKKILAAVQALRGEQQTWPSEGADVPVQLRRLSVMFCDIVGSTQLGEQFTIDEMQGLLQHYYDVASDVSDEHGGHVYGTQGDGVIILFGYPRVLEGFAERCILAAKSLQDRLAETPVSIEGYDPIHIATRIAIATGQAAIGHGETTFAGDTLQLIGPVVNRASRLQAVAEPLSIAVDLKTQELTRSFVQYSDAEKHDLKGLPKGIDVFHVLDIQDAEDNASSPIAMIGRKTELAALSDVWTQAQSGQCATATIIGDAGIGKSTLVDSFATGLDVEPARVIRLNCTSLGALSPLNPVSKYLDRMFEDAPGTPALAGVLSKDDGAAWQRVAQFLGLQNTRNETGAISKDDRADTLEILTQWIADGGGDPTLVVIENAQWADDTTRELMTMVAEHGRETAAKLLLLAVVRHSADDIWADQNGHQTIAVAPLEPKDAQDFLDVEIGGQGIPQTIRDRILRHSGGNPLMLETLGRAQAQQHLSDLSDAVEVPHTIYESVSKRLDGIRSGRHAIEALAVLDGPVRQDLLAVVTGQSVDTIVAAVRALESEGMVMQETSPSGNLASIRHQVYRDVIYEQLTGQSRQHLHGAAYSALFEFEPDIETHAPGVLALHANAARAWQDTSIHALNEGEALLKRSALIESGHYLDMADRALDRLPADTASNRLRLRVTTGKASVERSRFGIATAKSAELGQKAVELARDLGDSKTELLALNGLYAHALVGADYPRAEEYAHALLHTAERSQDKTFVMIGTRATGAVAFHRGEFKTATPLLERALEQYDVELHLPLTHAHGYDHAEVCSAFLSMSHWMRGDLAQGRSFSAFSIDHSRKIDHAHSLAQAMAFRVMLGALARDEEGMTAIGPEAEALAEKYDIRVMRAAARFFPFATRLCLRPDPPCSADMDRLTQLYEEFLKYNPFNYGPLVASLMADVQLRAGLVDAARTTVEGGVTIECKTGETWTSSELMRLRAQVLQATGHGAKARDARQAALRAANSAAAHTIALRIVCDMADVEPGPGSSQRVQDALSQMASADMGWDIQRARTILQSERRA